jgi:hypothetical protein
VKSEIKIDFGLAKSQPNLFVQRLQNADDRTSNFRRGPNWLYWKGPIALSPR